MTSVFFGAGCQGRFEIKNIIVVIIKVITNNGIGSNKRISVVVVIVFAMAIVALCVFSFSPPTSIFINSKGEWTLANVTSVKNTVYYPCCPVPYFDVTFTVHLKVCFTPCQADDPSN